MEKSNKPLSEQIADKIKEYIILNDLTSGDKIPPEKDLIVQMGVGRSTVREAIKYLVSRNVLEVRQGAGAFVTENVGMSDDPLGMEFIKDKKQLTYDLLEMRMIIEPQVAALAARHATDEDVAELEQLLMQVENKLLAHEEYLDDDILFHQKIAEMSKNMVIPKLTPFISQAVIAVTIDTKKKLVEETINMHREIFKGIKARDSMWAQEAMTLHLTYNRIFLRKMEEQE